MNDNKTLKIQLKHRARMSFYIDPIFFSISTLNSLCIINVYYIKYIQVHKYIYIIMEVFTHNKKYKSSKKEKKFSKGSIPKIEQTIK